MASRSYLIKVSLVRCEKSVAEFDSTKHRRHSSGIPVSFYSNTGPMKGGPTGSLRRTAQQAYRVIHYKQRHFSFLSKHTSRGQVIEADKRGISNGILHGLAT